MHDPLSLIVENINAETYIAQQNRFRRLANKPLLTAEEEDSIKNRLNNRRRAFMYERKEDIGDDDKHDWVVTYFAEDIDTHTTILGNYSNGTELIKKVMDKGYDFYYETDTLQPDGSYWVKFTKEWHQKKYELGQQSQDDWETNLRGVQI
tara:strand:- start:1705 stop:2154 length:450 start_codon:yes stop_codon:yes gene_type:complete